MLSKYLVPFSLIARLFTAMFCFDKQLTILITVSIKSIKKTEKWAMASFQLRPVYTTIIYCKKTCFLIRKTNLNFENLQGSNYCKEFIRL